MSMHRIAFLLQVSAQAALTWIRDLAKDYDEKPEPTGRTIVLQLDEMWHYPQKNGGNSGSGRLWIAIQATSWTGNVGVVMQQP
jgi:hypothetical protein